MPDDDVDLAPELRRSIDDLHGKLDALDHYALLGVARDADRKAIKGAYFAHAARLHPDRWFGKRLGAWKAKLEAVFGRMTTAHDTLTHPGRRAEYDAYLRQHAQIEAFERALDVDVDVPDMPVEERAVDPSAVRTGSTDRMRAVTPSPSPADLDRARREALARRLAGGSSRKMPAVAPPKTASSMKMPAVAPVPPKPTRAQAIEALVVAARAAAAAGDVATASNKMRVAARFDPTLATEADELSRRAHAAMADAYVAQARFEESEGRWVAAALSWVKALEGRPNDARIAERAANALRLGGGDLHRAARAAETAVRLAPNDVGCRLTLAEVYHAAQLPRRAAAELENARRLAPNDPRVRELAQRLG